MVDDPQSPEGISGGSDEWQLPARMSQLALGLDRLMSGLRGGIASAEWGYCNEVEKANSLLAQCESQVTSAKKGLADNLGLIKSKIAEHRRDLNAIMGQAEKHLSDQGLPLPRNAPNTMNQPRTSAGGQPASTPQEYLDRATEDIGEARAKLASTLGVTMPKQTFWPDNDALGCGGLLVAVVIASFLGNAVHSILFVIVFTGLFFAALLALLRYSQRVEIVDHLTNLYAVCQEAEDGFARCLASANDEYQQNAEGQTRVLDAATRKRDSATKEAEARRTAALNKVKIAAIPAVKTLHRDFDAFWRQSAFAAADWISPSWMDWSPDPSPGFAARIGTLTAKTDDLRRYFPSINWNFHIPALIPFASGRCLLLETQGLAKGCAAEAMQSVMLRMLANTPPGKMRFIFIDPVGLGQNVAGYMPLADHEEALINSKVWTRPQHIEQRLAELTNHMETVISKYLRNDYATIHEYNEKAQEVAEPYRFLVVFDFPEHFSESAARELVRIVQNGPRCGVYTLILRDTSKAIPYGFTIDDLERNATVIACDSDSQGPASPPCCVWQDMKDWLLTLDQPPSKDLFQSVISVSGKMAKDAMKVEVAFDKILSLASLDRAAWWTGSTARTIRAALGPTGARKLQYLTFGEGVAHHALVVGRTGSGKTNLMHVIIAMLALTYSPEEIRLYLIDFKGGVGFKPYAAQRLPHAAVIAIESEREFGISVLQGLDMELKRRFDLFRNAGVDNLVDYRSKTSSVLPRIFLLVDEFQEFFTQEDSISQQAKLVFDRIVKQGRAFGVHIMLGTQSLAGSAMLPHSTLDQMAIRIALQCSEADSRLILASDNAAARALTRPGEAIYNAAAGLIEGNNPFQAALFSEKNLMEYLEAIADLAKAAGWHAGPVVFEGNEPARIEECQTLMPLLQAGAYPDSVRSADVWLGEPIAIKPPIRASFRRQAGRHLLVVTREEEEGVGMLISAWAGLLAQHRPTTAQFYVFDLSTADAAWAGLTGEMRAWFNHEIEMLDRRKLPVVLTELDAEIKARLESEKAGRAPKYFFIFGLHRARDLRPEENGYFSSKADGPVLSHLFANILKDGPEVGVHVLAWCDTYTNAKRTLERSLSEFGMRVAGAMAADDSNSLVDSPVASRFGKPHRAVFYDEERPGVLDTFRPYGLADSVWLSGVASRLRKRKG